MEITPPNGSILGERQHADSRLSTSRSYRPSSTAVPAGLVTLRHAPTAASGDCDRDAGKPPTNGSTVGAEAPKCLTHRPALTRLRSPTGTLALRFPHVLSRDAKQLEQWPIVLLVGRLKSGNVSLSLVSFAPKVLAPAK